MNIVVLCLLFPTVSYLFYAQITSFRDIQLERIVEEQTSALQQRAALLLNSLSRSGSQAISEYNYSFLSTLIHKAVASNEELLACEFLNLEGKRAAATACLSDTTPEAAFNSSLTEEFIGKDLGVDFAEYSPPEVDNPHLLLARTHLDMGGKPWGFIYAAFSLEYRDQRIQKYKLEWEEQIRQYRFYFAGVTGLFFMFGVFVAYLFTRPLVRSIEGLRAGVDRVAGGDLSYITGFGNVACREFADLGKSFNSMTENLRSSRKQLDEYAHTLEDKVEERTMDLQEAQAELVDKAHEAGMAEMAVGVLHNIGNAITPAKVEARMLAKQLQNSKLRTGLAQALEPLPGLIERGDLSHEEKERLQKIVVLLPIRISQDYEEIISGLTNISDKHHYIEKVISLQMHYARLHGSPSNIDCNGVIRDALKMLDKQLHQVQVVTELNSTAQVCLEESKLLQVMVNLIKNSAEAMVEGELYKKRLVICSADNQDELCITVSDNGCGFGQAEKEDLFRFGYSSKSRGSGFGLHSCANYLIANGGSIEAYSEGVDKGAVFTVHLPASKPKGKE